jgi:hypothetical protein
MIRKENERRIRIVKEHKKVLKNLIQENKPGFQGLLRKIKK